VGKALAGEEVDLKIWVLFMHELFQSVFGDQFQVFPEDLAVPLELVHFGVITVENLIGLLVHGTDVVEVGHAGTAGLEEGGGVDEILVEDEQLGILLEVPGLPVAGVGVGGVVRHDHLVQVVELSGVHHGVVLVLSVVIHVLSGRQTHVQSVGVLFGVGGHETGFYTDLPVGLENTEVRFHLYDPY